MAEQGRGRRDSGKTCTLSKNDPHADALSPSTSLFPLRPPALSSSSSTTVARLPPDPPPADAHSERPSRPQPPITQCQHAGASASCSPSRPRPCSVPSSLILTRRSTTSHRQARCSRLTSMLSFLFVPLAATHAWSERMLPACPFTGSSSSSARSLASPALTTSRL